MIVPRADTKRSLESATSLYQEQLASDDEAMTYLLEGRQLMNGVVAYFRLGVVRDPLPGHEMYRGRLAIPYLTTTGVVSLRFKDLSGTAKAKVLTLPGDVGRVYNPLALRSAGPVALTEGEPDVWNSRVAGINACGIPGADAWSPIFRRIFRNRDVVVLADGDAAGRKFADTVYRSLGGCKIVFFPEGCDASDYRVQYGNQALRQKVGFGDE